MLFCSICEYVANKAYTSDIVDENTPPSIAAGIIYFVGQICCLSLTKQHVFNVSKTSEVTINKVYKKLNDNINELIPEVIIKKYNNY